ncbi:hypothetical protein Dimus_033023 [Dionaea muscipula]
MSMMKFKRLAAAFDEAVMRRPPCESSGSEHWPEEEGWSGDLSDLVNSFIDGDDHDHNHHHKINNTIHGNRHDHEVDDADEEALKKKEEEHNDVDDDEDGDDERVEYDRKAELMRLLAGDDDGSGGDGEVVVMEKVRDEIEIGCRVIGQMMNNGSTNGFKRLLMAHLRDQGYDAGLCKSRWERTARCPPGDYEYIDINIGRTRHIVELFLAREFEIARPTARYTALLATLQSTVFIGMPETLKRVVRLMTAAMKDSLKSAELHVAPWRRNGYMQSKWFGPYKRTINRTVRVPAGRIAGDVGGSSSPAKKRSVGFETPPTAGKLGGFCREDFASRVGLRVGLLAAAFQGS